MSLERIPELGTKPIALTVKLPAIKDRGADRLGEGLRELYRRGEMTDVALLCAEQVFSCHRVALASRSEVFKEGLSNASTSPQGPRGMQEVRLADIVNPEAVKFMLDYIYQEDAWSDFNPRTQEITKDVLRLAQNFRLPGLTERAMHSLSKDLTTGNVVERLTICEDFGLSALRERILEQLTYNKRALAEVASSPQIMNYPRLMQSMLQLAAGVPDPDSKTPPQPKKKARKA